MADKVKRKSFNRKNKNTKILAETPDNKLSKESRSEKKDKRDEVQGPQKFKESELRLLLLYGWITAALDDDNGEVSKSHLRKLLWELKEDKNVGEFFKMADPSILGFTLNKFDLLIHANKNEAIFKIKTKGLLNILKTLSTEERQFKMLMMQREMDINFSTMYRGTVMNGKTNSDAEKDKTGLRKVNVTAVWNEKTLLACLDIYIRLPSTKIDTMTINTSSQSWNIKLNDSQIESQTQKFPINRSIFNHDYGIYKVIICGKDGATGQQFTETHTIRIERSVDRVLRINRIKYRYSHGSPKQLPDHVADQKILTFLTDEFKISKDPLDLNHEKYGVLDRYMKSNLQLTTTNYTEILSILNEIEDLYVTQELNEFCLENKTVEETKCYLDRDKEKNDKKKKKGKRREKKPKQGKSSKDENDKNVDPSEYCEFKIVIADDKIPTLVSEGDLVLLYEQPLKELPQEAEIVGEIDKLNLETIVFVAPCFTHQLKAGNLIAAKFLIKFRKIKVPFIMMQEALFKLSNNNNLQLKPTVGDKGTWDQLSRFKIKVLEKQRDTNNKNNLQILSDVLLVGDKDMSKQCCSLLRKQSSDFTNLVWSSQSIATNEQQQTAVEKIVNKRSGSIPFILFGPPGTGKTTTLVEAIVQIWKLKPHDRILVTAYSNSAVDEIAKRLLKFIPSSDCFRYYSQSMHRKRKEIDPEILKMSNLRFEKYINPSVLEILSYRIVITTLITSGWLPLKGCRSDTFSYIFIDECASCVEASAIIPITNFTQAQGYRHGQENHVQIVLAGDPKQLGSVINCRTTEELGLGVSLMERLMTKNIYKPDSPTFNPNAYTKLLQNFRSHEAILRIPNDLFYDGQLMVKATEDVINWALNWNTLPNKNFPIIFHATKGRCETYKDSTSLCNKKEVEMVLDYTNRLLLKPINGVELTQADIGIVTPYRRQCVEIKKCLRKFGFDQVEVGSVEQFQGQERKVIILSTVRSMVKTIGFLSNPRRMNVAITRAQALLIVIGNPDTLSLDKNWSKFIEFCDDNDAVIGEWVKPILVEKLKADDTTHDN